MSRIEKNINQRKNSGVKCHIAKNKNKKIKPERSSTSGYLIDILTLQK